jgi:hypothetical protein
MGASLQSRAQRLLAVVFFFWALCATQAHTFTPAALSPARLAAPRLSLRLEAEDPSWNRPACQEAAPLRLEPPIGIFCGGDPLNYFDSDGRCADPYGINSIDSRRGDPVFRTLQNGLIDVEATIDGVWNFGIALVGTPQYGTGQNTVDALGNPLARLGLYPQSSSTMQNQYAAGTAGQYGQYVLNSLMPVGQETPSPTMSEPVPMLTEPNSLVGNVTGAYQQFYNTGWQTVVQRFNQGEITIPAGQSWQTVLGQQVDQYARGALLNYLGNEGIPEGPTGQVLVNRQLFDPSGSGNYRIPDVQIPSAGLILDGTIGSKNLSTSQIQDFIPYSGGAVNIITPTVLPRFNPAPAYNAPSFRNP